MSCRKRSINKFASYIDIRRLEETILYRPIPQGTPDCYLPHLVSLVFKPEPPTHTPITPLERERQRQTDRQTDRQKDRKTDRDRETQTETDRQTGRYRNTETGRQRQTDRDRNRDGETDREIEGETDRQTGQKAIWQCCGLHANRSEAGWKRPLFPGLFRGCYFSLS